MPKVAKLALPRKPVKKRNSKLCMYLRKPVLQRHFIPRAEGSSGKGWGTFSDLNCALAYVLGKRRGSNRSMPLVDEQLRLLKEKFPTMIPAEADTWVPDSANPLRVANVDGFCEKVPEDQVPQTVVATAPAAKVGGLSGQTKVVYTQNGKRMVYYVDSPAEARDVLTRNGLSSFHLMPSRFNGNGITLYPLLECDAKYVAASSASLEIKF